METSFLQYDLDRQLERNQDPLNMSGWMDEQEEEQSGRADDEDDMWLND